MVNLGATDWLVSAWQLQVALGSGYAAYMVAYTGIRSHHQAVDTTFRTIAFGLVATAVMLALPNWWRPIIILMAFVATVTVALLWRMNGMRWWIATLRNLDVSWSDDTPSAWAKFSQDQDSRISQLQVVTTDDRVFICDDAEAFADRPQGPCVLGTNGDLTMYVTHTKALGDTTKQRSETIDVDGWGTRMTYIPADKIQRLQVRRTSGTKTRRRRSGLFSRRRLAASAGENPTS